MFGSIFHAWLKMFQFRLAWDKRSRIKRFFVSDHLVVERNMQGTLILNNGPIPEAPAGFDIAAKLRGDMNRLKGEFYDLERGRVDYQAMQSSDAYREYTVNAALLRNFALTELLQREEKLAFWVNIYNTLVIHGIIELGIRESVREITGFFSRFSYTIDGLAFTPDDIEHGILRGNRHPPYRLFRPFSSSDQRLSYIIYPPDPRIHFTLVCGSTSCPPINFYSADRIGEQMDLAASGFINGPEVEILLESKLLRLSPIFKWYSSDFGGHKGIVDFLIRYREAGKERDFLLEHGMKAEIEWKEYDWRLNH